MSVVDIRAEAEELRQEALAAKEAADAHLAAEAGMAKMLAPFADNLPYNRDRVISEVKFCLQVEIVARFEIGKRLLLLQAHEGATTLSHLLTEYFPGMNRRSAERYMLFARKASDFPKFRAFANGRDNWSKALTIMSEVDEEELRELEEGGSVMDMTLEDVDTMSVRELKSRIKKLEKRAEEAVAAAVEQAVKDNEKVREEVEVLKTAANPGFEAALDMVEKAGKKLKEAVKCIRSIPQAMMEQERRLQDLLLATCGTIRRVVDGVEDEILAAGGGIAHE